MKNVEVRGAYSYDSDAVSAEAVISDYGPSKTVQSQEEEANINSIVNRFLKTGALPDNFRTPGQLLEDVTDVNNDFHAAWNLVAAARESFMMLPAQVRSRFDNDPGLYFDFIESNPDADTVEKFGLGRKDAETVAAAAAASPSSKGGSTEGGGKEERPA